MILEMNYLKAQSIYFIYADKLEELKRFAGSVIKSNYELALY